MRDNTFAWYKSRASINIKTQKNSKQRERKHRNKECLQIVNVTRDTTRDRRFDDVDTHQSQKEMRITMKQWHEWEAFATISIEDHVKAHVATQRQTQVA